MSKYIKENFKKPVENGIKGQLQSGAMQTQNPEVRKILGSFCVQMWKDMDTGTQLGIVPFINCFIILVYVLQFAFFYHKNNMMLDHRNVIYFCI